MKHHFRRAACLTASLLLCGQLIPVLPAAAVAVQEHSVSADEPVSVIIRLNGDGLLGQLGRDGIASAEAAEQSGLIAEMQAAVQAKIRKIYPALTVGAGYDVLMNGFSCCLPAALLDRVREMPEVAAAEPLPEIQVPQMSNAPALSGLPQMQEQYGCTGEGQVIAVIDSELCADHPMFAALPDETGTKLSKDDIAEVIDSGMLHMSVDPDLAYRSSKLPYAIDYIDDPYEGLVDPDNYHGTHVSGIAAGNAFVTDEGRTVSGIARDAQLIFMGVGTSGFRIDGEAALLALEDAVVLGADVINMSWGSFYETFQDNIFADVLTAADNAGISVCISAGNADNGTRSLHRTNHPDDPDVSTIDNKTNAESCAFVVASADNSTVYRHAVLEFEGAPFRFVPTVKLSGEPDYLTDHLQIGAYEYADCGELRASDVSAYAETDLSGKIMVIGRTQLSVNSAVIAAKNCNAAGLLIADSIAEEGTGYFCSGTAVPTGFITPAQYELLKNAADKILVNPGANIEESSENKMSFYTSWGTAHSLDLRPDITGIGGSVESAAYGGGTAVMSGTSMASPYTAGCAAVIREYLRAQNVDVSGIDLTKYVRILLMNSAVPYAEDGLYVSPRQQGAGQVSVGRAAETFAVLTGPEGDAKINLYDRIGDSFDFDVTLTNLCDADIRFADAQLLLTTDDAAYDADKKSYVISGRQAIPCSTDLSALTEIGAGQSQTVTLRVTLDADKTAAVSEIYRNGFFLDGFLLLSGAENCADISIPLCGYYGDWAEIPILRKDRLSPRIQLGNSIVPPGMPLKDAFPLIRSILARIPADEMPEIEYDTDWYRLLALAEQYASEDELWKLENGTDEIWYSPNGDAMADRFLGVNFEHLRQARMEYRITDENGNSLVQDTKYLPPPSISTEQNPDSAPLSAIAFSHETEEFDEGTYTLHADYWIDYPGAETHPQSFDLQFRADRTAPEVYWQQEIRDNRKLLTAHISDNGEADCVFIFGNRKAPENPEEQPAEDYSAMDLLRLYRALRGGAFWASDAQPEKQLPYFLRQLAKTDLSENPLYNFSDMIPLYPDFAGNYSFEYDVTDLTDYSFVVIDKAYNFAEYASEGGAELSMQEGVWNDPYHGLIEFYGDTARTVSYADAKIRTYHYTLIDRKLTLTSDDETIVRELFFEDTGTVHYVEEGSGYSGKMTFWRNSEVMVLEDFPFHSVEEVRPLLYSIFEMRTGERVADCTMDLSVPYSVNFRITAESGTEYNLNVNLINGIGSGYGTGQFNVFSKPLETIEPGIYSAAEQNGFYLVFHADGSTGKLLVLRSNPLYGLYEFEDQPFTYTIGENGSAVFRFPDDETEASVTVSADGDTEIFFRSAAMFTFTRSEHGVADEAAFHNASQLLDIAAGYEEQVSGVRPEDSYTSDITDEAVGLDMWNGSEYHIDPFTLKGTDEMGRAVDLTNAPMLPENAKTLEQLRDMAAKDFSQKTGRTDFTASAKITPDGNVQISFISDEYDLIGRYFVDPETAKGTDENGAAVDLPQTGNQSPAALLMTALGILLLAGGVFALRQSIRA